MFKKVSKNKALWCYQFQKIYKIQDLLYSMRYAIRAVGNIIYERRFQEHIKAIAHKKHEEGKNEVYLFFGQSINTENLKEGELEKLLVESKKEECDLSHNIFREYKLTVVPFIRIEDCKLVHENADTLFKRTCEKEHFDKKQVCVSEKIKIRKEEVFPHEEGYHVLGF